MKKSMKKAVLTAVIVCLSAFAGCGIKKGSDENKQGLAYYEVGQYEKAIASYDEAIALNAEEADYFVNKTYAEIGLGNLDEAKQTVNTALSLENADGYTYRCAGIVSYDREEYADAISYFQQALTKLQDEEDDDGVRDVQLYMAEAYEKTDDLASAISVYSQVIAANEKDAESYYLRGKCYAAEDEMDLAVADFESLRALAPAKMSYYIDIYEMLSDANREDEGLTYLESAVKLKAKTKDEKKNHGIIQYLLGNYEDAQSELSDISKDDRDVNTWIYLGFSEQALGNSDAASEDYEKALACADNRAEVFYHIAMLEMKLGEYSAALKDISDGLAENDPEMTQKLAFAEVVATEKSCDYAGALQKLIAYRDTYGTTDEIDHEIAWLQTR